jgi:chromate transporter
VAAWLGFTLPSALALTLFGLLLVHSVGTVDMPWLHGLKVAAVAVVAQALWGMGKNLCPDKERASLAVAAAIFAVLLPGTVSQIGVLVIDGFSGYALADSHW